MEIRKTIQVIYTSGTFGNCVRWMFDRFTKGSKFVDVDSPWDNDDRVHGFNNADFNTKFKKSHQLNSLNGHPDPHADKVVISFDPKDLLFAERCGFYRNPGCENEKGQYNHIIDSADGSFVKETFGDVVGNKSVAKELIKIQFHDIGKHTWWNSMNEFLTNKSHHHFNLCSLWDHALLKDELTKVSDRYNLEFNIDEKVIHNVVEKIKKSYPVVTKDRAHQVLDAIESKNNMECNELDIIEQAYIEAELEKIHDCVIFPYGVNWFKDTDQINEFIDTYPTYLKHMNPRLPWYNNIKNPFYLKGKID
jgi:hypothetical protein